MKLTVLVDNNTYIDKYFYGEPGLCFYIEDGKEKILLDTGYSDLFIRNAKKLGIDLSALTKIVISHGHDDHTGGLPHLLERFDTSSFQVITHPDTFAEKRRGDLLTGSPVSEETMREKTSLILSKDPVKISDHITFLGEIPITQEFEQRPKMDTRKTPEGYVPDYILEDSALIYETASGVYVITGCSHAGICNMCAYAKELTNKPVLGIIGGWHMKKMDERAEKTISYMKNEGISEMYPCHCTSFAVKAAVHQEIPVHEVGVGLTVEW